MQRPRAQASCGSKAPLRAQGLPAAFMNEHTHSPDERIDLSDDANARRWMDHFGVTLSQLEEAIQAAGTRVADIEAVLRDQGASAGAS